jgi:hypothetical protein
MWHFQATTGRTVLTGPPDGRYFELWVGGIPMALVTTLLASIWVWTVYRSPRCDRLVVALSSACPLACLWFVSAWWVVRKTARSHSPQRAGPLRRPSRFFQLSRQPLAALDLLAVLEPHKVDPPAHVRLGAGESDEVAGGLHSFSTFFHFRRMWSAAALPS